MPSPHFENRRAPARVIRVEGAGGAAAPRALAASILAQLGAPDFDEPEGVVRAYALHLRECGLELEVHLEGATRSDETAPWLEELAAASDGAIRIARPVRPEFEREREPAVAVDTEKRSAPTVHPVRPASSVRRWAVAAGAAVLLVGLGMAARQQTVPSTPAATEPAPRSSAQPVVAQPRTSFPKLAYDPTTGRLWGVAEDVELDELLQDIGELAAIRVESRIALSERVTQRFNGDTLETGLRGLLGGFETAFRHEVDAKGVERLRAVRVLGRREGREQNERSEPGGELDRVLRELVDDPVNAKLDATIRVLAASGPQPEAFELLTDLGARRATEGQTVRLAHARLRSAMCRAWAGSPEASTELEILRCRKPPRARP